MKVNSPGNTDPILQRQHKYSTIFLRKIRMRMSVFMVVTTQTQSKITIVVVFDMGMSLHTTIESSKTKIIIF